MNKIARASIILMIGTIISKILGFARELMIAYRFGAGSISDAFVLTNSIPTLIFSAIAVAININFIPYYHRIERDNEKDLFTSNLTNIILIILLIGCILINIFPHAVLKVFATGLSEQTEKYAIVMLRIVVFSIIPIIISYIYQAYLQANELFTSTALYGVLTNIVVIMFTLFATEDKYYILSLGTISSHIIGLVPIMYCVIRETEFKYTPYVNFRDTRIKELVLLTMPLIVENLASSFSLLVDRNLASFLDEGTISGLSYAGNLGNIASTMIATAIMTATFPLFSKMLSVGDKNGFSSQFKRYANVISYLLSPISIFMILNARDIVTVLFEHGSFNNTATAVVSESMICYAVGVLPMGLQSYLIRGFYAMQDTKTPVNIKVFALICNIVMNLMTVKFMKHMGIALSTSVSYVIAYFMLTYSLKKKHGIEGVGNITSEASVSLIMSVISGMTILFLFNKLVFISNLFIKLITEGIIFVCLYLGMMVVLKKDRFNDVVKIFKK